MEKIQVLGICGSLRSGSFNRKLVLLALEEIKQLGAETTFLDLRELNMPIFDQDLEDRDGMPTGAQKLVDEINKADALVIGNPEYNSGITAALKNAIDWASRAEKNPFINKVVVLVGTSPGAFGAARSSLQTRLILSHLQANVIPAIMTLPTGDQLTNEKGQLTADFAIKQLKRGASELVRYARAMKASN